MNLVDYLASYELRHLTNVELCAEGEFMDREVQTATGEYKTYCEKSLKALRDEVSRRIKLKGQTFKPFAPGEVISLIKEKTSLLELIGHDTQVDFNNGVAVCPIHHEEHASIKIYDDKTWYCFGCGAGGDCFEWLMAYHHFSFKEAVEALARLNGIELPTPISERKEYVSYEKKDYI